MAITKRSVSDYDLTPDKGKDSQVNWGQVAVDFSKQLMDARQRKIDKQEKVKEDFEASMEKLGDIPETDDLNVQAKLIKASQISMKTLQDRYAQVKDGIISPEDFAIYQTNQKSQYKTTGAILKNIGGWTQQIQERIEKGTATNVDLAVYDYLQGYGGLKGHNIVEGEDGMLQIGKLKYKMTPKEAREQLSYIRMQMPSGLTPAEEKEYIKSQGLDPATTSQYFGYMEDISNAEVQKYIQQNSGYGTEFSKNRADFIGVDQLAQLFMYQGDNQTIVDIGAEITNQVSVLADYVTTEIDSYDGSKTTTYDFRNMPGVDPNKTAYEEVLEDLQNTLLSTPNGIVQVMTEIGGKKIATSMADMRKKYGKDAKTVDAGGDVILINMENGVVSIVSNTEKLYEAAKIEIDEAVNSQISSKVEESGPNSALLNYRLNRKIFDQGQTQKAAAVSGIGKDIKNIIEGGAGTAGAVSDDRIEDMNMRLNKDGIKIKSIKRDGESIIINRVQVDQFGQETDISVTIDNTGALSQSDIARKLYRVITPKEILNNYAYDGFIKLLEDEEDFSLEPRMIKDPKDPTKMIANPNYKGQEGFQTAEIISTIRPYDPTMDATTPTADLFKNLTGKGGEIDNAANAVNTAYTRGLNRHGISVSVEGIDVSMSGTNEIVVNYKDPSTNRDMRKVFYFDDDQVKLQGDVTRHINELIGKLNTQKQNQGGGGGGAPSDKRLKENIKLVGQSPSGVNIYTWNYKDQDKYPKGKHSGVIAQEVPWAVVKVNDYLFVDYSKVDVEFNKIS